jgi:tRNA(fMet)-specific endonuclease VapC
VSQRYLLDTNVLSHIMQGREAQLLAHLTTVPVGQAVMSGVTLAELECGLHRKGQPVRLRNALTQILLRIDVLPWNEEVAVCYGELCATLKAQGTNLSDFDMMIAAHAVALDLILVSRDKAFAQVLTGMAQHLRLEVW